MLFAKKGFPLQYEIGNSEDSDALNSECGHLVYLLPLVKACASNVRGALERPVNAIFNRIFVAVHVDAYYA